jgi:hypothetical protein
MSAELSANHPNNLKTVLGSAQSVAVTGTVKTLLSEFTFPDKYDVLEIQAHGNDMWINTDGEDPAPGTFIGTKLVPDDVYQMSAQDATRCKVVRAAADGNLSAKFLKI